LLFRTSLWQTARAVVDFRYAQFCPVARACELLASRWTLLVLRDLFTGPLRFSDLLRALPGISTSVLAERLSFLEERGLVARRELPPPAASAVYELTATGRAAKPLLTELVRFGARFMGASQQEDHVEPRWVPLGLEAFARRGPSPARRFEVRVVGGPEPVVFRAIGGPQGTRVERGPGPADLTLEAGPREILGLAAGLLPGARALAAGLARVSGDASALGDFPGLFEMDLTTPT
jgi:DNA-binding HxlR family transcriptional regulator